jgi:hypothetical protein
MFEKHLPGGGAFLLQGRKASQTLQGIPGPVTPAKMISLVPVKGVKILPQQ